jgi:hypothetical protein
MCLAVLLLLGCAKLGIGFTKIGDLIAAPQKFAQKEVSIKGKVTNVLKIPFVSTKIYTVQDNSGEINVRTFGEVPLIGSAVKVKGAVDSVALIGEQTTGLHLREIERW